jgi:hypothetical protein
LLLFSPVGKKEGENKERVKSSLNELKKPNQKFTYDPMGNREKTNCFLSQNIKPQALINQKNII